MKTTLKSKKPEAPPRQAPPTIVEYSATKRPRNLYPERIISPPQPSPCCASRMEQVGEVQQQDWWRFAYRRCKVCGYTVRHFLYTDPPDLWFSGGTSWGLRRTQEFARDEDL